jgi:hypothetical protein
MTDNTNTAPTEKKNDVTGYAISVTPITIDTLEDRRGKPYMKARVTAIMSDGRQVERTLMARGRALEAINDNIAVGKTSRLRVIFSKTDQGAPFLTALCMARHQPGDAAPVANDQAAAEAAA